MVWNYLAEIASAFYLIVILIYSRRYQVFPSTRNRFFVRMVAIVLATVIISIITVFFTEQHSLIPYSINLLLHTIFFLIYPWISVLFFYYTLYVVYEDRESLIIRIQLLSSVFIVLYSILVFINIRFGFIFKLDHMGYHPQLFEPLIFVVAYIYMGLMIYTIETNRKNLDQVLRYVLIAYVLITTIFVTIQYFNPHFLLVGTAAGLSILIMYLYIQSKELVSDYLTRLPNRVAYEGLIKYRLKSKKQLKTIVISLSDFKNINNMYGQKNGDRLLRELTQYFVELVGRVNVFRYSGDKFALLYYEEDDSYEYLITSIQDRFKQSWLVNDSLIYIESILIHVDVNTHVKNEHELLAIIDYMIDKCKSDKSHLPSYSTENTIHEVNRKSQLNEYINKALVEDLFHIVVQPIYDLKNKSYRHAEVLLRLEHPTLKDISPVELIPLAEESGRIIELGLWVLRKTLEFLRKCDENNIYLDMVSINFSVVQMNDANVVLDVDRILNEFPKYRHKIAIEITESIFIADYNRIIDQMLGLKGLGINFYLDDFGTGYSNVLNVIKLPLSVIKIDKSLIYESIRNISNRKLIHGLSDAFKESGMTVLAEGIETQEQFQIVKDMQVDYIQGYLFAKPMSISDTIEFLLKHKV
ncbi:MAG: EAL domain-containing protein [Erysipelotrichaceae bacterium]